MGDAPATRRTAALAFLAAHRVMTLATTGPEGLWAAAVFYVNSSFDLFYLSAGHTRHARNLAADPRTAVTIQPDDAPWTAIQGIQLSGMVSQLEGKERDRALALYIEKFPFLADAPPPLAAALTRVNWYRVRPTRLFFVDNTVGFGHRDEIDLG